MMGSKRQYLRSIDELEGQRWGDPAPDATFMVHRCHALRRKPLTDLTPSEIGLCIRQGIGLPFILDLALDKLRHDPLIEGEFYPGDVLAALIKLPDSAWIARPHLYAELQHIRQEAISAIEADSSGELFILAGELNPQP